MADTVRRADYFHVTVPNRAGQGARILKLFRDAKVNLLAFHAFPQGATAQLDLFPQDPRAFLRAAKAAGLKVSPRRTAFLIQGRDRVGAVAELLERLAAAKVNVVAMDAVSTGGKYGAILWVRRNNVALAAKALGVK